MYLKVCVIVDVRVRFVQVFLRNDDKVIERRELRSSILQETYVNLLLGLGLGLGLELGDKPIPAWCDMCPSL